MRLETANARIGARRSRLLRREDFHALLAQPTVEGQAEVLRGLAPELEIPWVNASITAIEAALRAHQSKEESEILAAVAGSRARALLRAWLGLEEADAVKAVARALLFGGQLDESTAAAPATPGLESEVVRAALSAHSVEKAMAILAESGSSVAQAAADAWAPFADHPERVRSGLPALELAADRAAFARAFRVARGSAEDAGLLREHLEDLVDVRNARTVLLGVGHPQEPAGDGSDEGPFLPGGRRLSMDDLRTFARLEAPRRREALSERLKVPALALGSAALAEVTLEAALSARLRRKARLLPLSLAVPLAYLADRSLEMRRLALTFRGAALGLPGEELLPLVEGSAP